MTKTSPGRPKKKKGTAQNKCVSVWLLEDEKASVDSAARSTRLPTSTWAGKVLVEAAKRALAAVGV
jgi:hypothetical protein